MQKNKILFIGLGVMGHPMALHLAKQYDVAVYNRTTSKAHDWLKEVEAKSDYPHNYSVLTELNDIPTSINVIITCIGKDSDLREIYLSDGGLCDKAAANTLLIDHTTASASIAQEIEKACEEKNLSFIDAPVSGGEQGAINGQLTTMCGGKQAAFESAEPFLSVYSKAVNLMGPSGSGQLTKMANQIAVAGVVQGLSESLHFAENAGLDCHKVIEVISKGAAQSWQMENRHKTMINKEYEHGFAVDLMRKDLDIVLSQAKLLDASLPITALIDQFYADVQKMGGGRWDTSSLLERLRKD